MKISSLRTVVQTRVKIYAELKKDGTNTIETPKKS